MVWLSFDNMNAFPCFCNFSCWDLCCSCDQITHLHVFSSVFHCLLRYARKLWCSVRLYSHLVCRKFMLYVCKLYSLSYTGVYHDFHFRWCSCRLSATRMVSLVEQELLTLPQFSPGFVGVLLLLPLCYIKENKMWNRNCVPYENTSGLLRGSCSSIFSFLCSVL